MQDNSPCPKSLEKLNTTKSKRCRLGNTCYCMFLLCFCFCISVWSLLANLLLICKTNIRKILMCLLWLCVCTCIYTYENLGCLRKLSQNIKWHIFLLTQYYQQVYVNEYVVSWTAWFSLLTVHFIYGVQIWVVWGHFCGDLVVLRTKNLPAKFSFKNSTPHCPQNCTLSLATQVLGGLQWKRM